jgi:hypothetical protein
MKVLANTLIKYIQGSTDIKDIEVLIEAERNCFDSVEWDWITRELKPYEFENPLGIQVFSLLGKYEGGSNA